MLLIDQFLPRYDLAIVHAEALRAAPEMGYRAARSLDLFRAAVDNLMAGPAMIIVHLVISALSAGRLVVLIRWDREAVMNTVKMCCVLGNCAWP